LKRWKKIKPRDQTQYLVSRFPNRGSSYKKRYRNTLHEIKKLSLFYGGISKKTIKKLIKKTINIKNKKINSLFLELFESRLDTTLYRSKFCLSIKNARQLILHGKINVNNKIIKIKSYHLKSGDIISINFKCYPLIEENIRECKIWPIPPKHLTINYKSMQIIFGTFKNINFSLNIFYRLNLEKVLNSSYQH